MNDADIAAMLKAGRHEIMMGQAGLNYATGDSILVHQRRYETGLAKLEMAYANGPPIADAITNLSAAHDGLSKATNPSPKARREFVAMWESGMAALLRVEADYSLKKLSLKP